jgi:hypothetical protein
MNTDVCLEIEPLLAGFALEALDGGDRARVLAHLPSCEHCQAVLADYLAVAEGLMSAPPAGGADGSLRRNLAAAIRPANGGSSLFGVRVPAWTGIALLAVLLVANLLVLGRTWEMIRGQQAHLDQLTAEQSRLSADLQANQTAVALVSCPTSEVVRLQGESAYGTFVYDPDMRVAVLYAWGLDPLPADETYQAWLIDAGGTRSSAGIFQPSEGGRFTVFIVNSSFPIGDFSGLGVTVEPSGSSSGPTGPRVLAADF